MIMTYLNLAWKYRKIVLFAIVAAAFLYLTYQLKAQKAEYLQQTALLKETISDMREANAEAFRQQQISAWQQVKAGQIKTQVNAVK